MRATIFERHGASRSLVMCDVPTPVPEADQIVLRLGWAAVNHLDLDIRNGISGMTIGLPHILGTEGTGTVSAVGSAVQRLRLGQRVGTYAFRTCRRCKNCLLGRQNMCLDVRTLGGQLPGTYAEYVVVRQDQAVEVPEGLSLQDAIASYKYATAWEALVTTAALQPGEIVLVTGAGGGVGVSAVILARHLGATVIAATGSDAKNRRLLDLGASHVVNYRAANLTKAVQELTRGAGVDLVLDVAAGDGLRDAIAATRPGGRIAVVGAHSGERVEVDMLDLFRRHISIHGCGRYTTDILQSVFQALVNGLPSVPVHGVFELADAGLAHQVMEGRDFLGRLLLYCGAGSELGAGRA